MHPESVQLAFEQLQEHHALNLFEPFQAKEIYRFIPESPPESLESARREFANFSAGPREGSDEIWYNWAIRDADREIYFGTLQATIFADGLLWIGYKLAPIYWNMGIATRSLKWLVAELENLHPGLPVHASVDTRNHASTRALEKAGFVLVRTEIAETHGLASEDFIYKFEII